MLSDFLSLVFPRTCVACHRTLISAEQFLCTPCKSGIPQTSDASNPSNKLFQKFAYQPKIKTSTAFMYFNQGGIAQKILHEIKYNRAEELAEYMGWMLATGLPQVKIDFIIPIPLHLAKHRVRTFNQSEAMALGISKQLDVPYRADLIERVRNTSSQTKKGKADRWLNVENIYSECKESLSGCSVLVVDDVITTGATTGMLCERLSEAEVSEMHIATLARR